MSWWQIGKTELLACWHQRVFRLTRWKGIKLHPEEQFPPLFVRVHCVRPPLQNSPPQVKAVQSKCWNKQSFFQVARWRIFTPAGGVSCAKPGGQNGRSCVHSRGTGMAWLLCACGSVSLARLNGQTSKCSLPTCTCRVSHLYEKYEIWLTSVKPLISILPPPLSSKTHTNIE